MTRRPDPDLTRRVAELLRRAADGRAAPEVEARSRARALASLAEGGRRGRWLRPGLVLGGLALGGLAVLLTRAEVTPRELTYSADGLSARAESWVPAAPERGGELRFSDGSRVALEAGGRARVVELDPRGASLRLESGELEASIVPRRHARWRVLAGPYLVRVTGTRFRVTWQPDAGRFQLRLTEGSVVLSGPGLPAERRLSAGESIALGPDAPGSAVAAPDRAPAPGDAADPGPPVPTEEPAGTPRARPAGPGEDTAGPWAAMVTAGRFAEVVSQARARSARGGLPRLLGALGGSELAALADAARYAGEQELARAALAAETRRFPRGERGTMALFLLARSWHDHGAGPRALPEAIGLYARYLAARPDGVFAAEALSRMMQACHAIGQVERARRLAREYLRRFPGGPAEAEARRLTER